MTTTISNPLKWEELIKVLKYDISTGEFTWLETRGRIPKNTLAGSIGDDGYSTIRINRKEYKSHRLAWFYCFQEWPTLDIDHINRNRSDNALDNLREVSRADNNRNSLARNTTGIKNVYKNGSSYSARVAIDNKDNYLGSFKTVELANEAVNKFKKDNNI